MRKVLPQKFFNQPALKVAQDLLGKFLVRKYHEKNPPAGGALMITEVEAYDGFGDKASHAHKGKTERNKIMFGEPGKFYIYFTYGIHWMLNIVTGPKNYPAAVLIRGGIIYKNQQKVKILNGPAKLTKYLKIDKKFNNKSADKKTGLWIEDRGIKINKGQIIKNKRIGVDYAGEWADKLYRFSIDQIVK